MVDIERMIEKTGREEKGKKQVGKRQHRSRRGGNEWQGGDADREGQSSMQM